MIKVKDATAWLKTHIVLKTIGVQLGLLAAVLVILWGSQKLYSAVDQTTFPEPMPLPANAENLPENEKGKILLDAITYQLRRELDSSFGWTFNDLIFNRFFMDNRAYREYGVYHATKFLLDLYSTQIAKLGSNDRESQQLYQARINNFVIDPRSFWFPSAEGAYEKGFKLLEQYKDTLDKGTGVYNARTDDLYASFVTVTGENLLGYALGLLENSKQMPFYELDNRIYEVQGMVLVLRDFISTLYALYPEIKAKNNQDNFNSAMEYLNRICNYDPLIITSFFNSGELIASYLVFAKTRLEDIRDSIRM
ncbi:MAG: DUF2333 family protein [Desulfovibrio sp.]|nr:DUF2333 family protein [Desulfovibrio sp.]